MAAMVFLIEKVFFFKPNRAVLFMSQNVGSFLRCFFGKKQQRKHFWLLKNRNLLVDSYNTPFVSCMSRTIVLFGSFFYYF